MSMDEKLQEDWLDARLRDEAPYIDDAGFTSRVVQKLPARRRARSLSARSILLGIDAGRLRRLPISLSGGGQFLRATAFTDVSP